MLFNPAVFLFLIPLVTVAYFLCPHPFRWALLLLVSCIFYMWFIPLYLLILFLLIGIHYYMGILIEDARIKGAQARKYLILSILATGLSFFVLKYFNFFILSFSALGDFLGLHYPPHIINLILTIGLSFHVLQSFAYVIEVYSGKQKAERHLGMYSLYVMFYPQFVAGPIERPYNLIPQFREKHFIDYQRIADAFKLIVWGLFKKVVIADRLAVLVNQVFGDVRSYHGPEFFIATIFFVIQIYCDLSGFRDIAIGFAKAMGFRFSNNFGSPFFTKSMEECWKRWSMTFSSWLKEYVYRPLGGIRWGIWIWQMAIAFFLASFLFIFLRVEDVQEAFFVIKQLLHGWGDGFLRSFLNSLGFSLQWWVTSIELIVVLLLMDLLQKNVGERFVFSKDPVWVRWFYYYGLVLAIIILGNYERNIFFYFQF